MKSTTLGVLLISCILSNVAAQFQFFDNFFNQGGQQGHGQQGQDGRGQSKGADWYRQQVLDTQCDPGQYLCPDTLACVAGGAANCPCPSELVRCAVGKSSVCVSRSEKEGGCGLVDKYRTGALL